MISLETDRLIIRSFSPDDWQELQELAIRYRASESAKYEDPWPTSAEEIKGMASWFAGGDDYLAASLKATGKLMGLIAIAHKEEREGRVHGLGYVFHEDYHGRGYATEGCRAAMAHLFDRLAADRILTGTHPDNTASVALLTNLGLREIAGGEYTISRRSGWRLKGRMSEDAARSAMAPTLQRAYGLYEGLPRLPGDRRLVPVVVRRDGKRVRAQHE